MHLFSGENHFRFGFDYLKQQNLQLEKFTSMVGELQSKLENSELERNSLLYRLQTLETEIYLKKI